jgi:hypothetical protein
MGLHVSIYRSQHDSEANVFHGAKSVTVVNLPGPFEPTPEAPAARLWHTPYGDPILVPDTYQPEKAGPMNGGTFAATSDSRWNSAVGYRAIPVHDRFETWAQYEEMTRD